MRTSTLIVSLAAAFTWLPLYSAEARPGSDFVCRVPAAYSPMHYGYEEALLQSVFRHRFESAVGSVGPVSGRYVWAFRAMNRDFGLQVNVEAKEGELAVRDQQAYGVRVSDPVGLRGLPKQAVEKLLNPPPGMELAFGLQGMLLVNWFASECVGGERSKNEQIAANIVGANTAQEVYVPLLEWVVRLRDAECIDAGAYGQLSSRLAGRVQAMIDGVEIGEQIFAVYVLMRAGYEELLDPVQITRVVGYMVQEARPSRVVGNSSPSSPDVMAAGAYVLAHLLLQGRGERQDRMEEMVRQMRVQGVVKDSDVIAQVTPMKLEVAGSCETCETPARSEL
jgi:hypothetical protein